MLRFIAAVLVVIFHAANDGFAAERSVFASFGNEAVLLFFVLSGLVIAISTAKPHQTLSTYAFARFTRIYSVAIPALFLSFGVGFWLQMNGAPILNNPGHLSVYDALGSLFMLNEVWSISTSAPVNSPYWSLVYEAWYYVAFAAFMFGPKRWRWVLLAGIFVVAGPLIALLAPVWLLGVWIALDGRLRIRNEIVGWVFWMISLVAFIALSVSQLRDEIRETIVAIHPALEGLQNSAVFPYDYLIGLLATLNFISFRAISHRFAVALRAIGPAVRFAAAYTFSIYLFHRPLLQVVRSFEFGRLEPTNFWLLVMGIVVATMGLGHVTERRLATVKKWLAPVWSPRPRIVG
ncbi:MAG: acyltransferase [Pacificimonas sp.]